MVLHLRQSTPKIKLTQITFIDYVSCEYIFILTQCLSIQHLYILFFSLIKLTRKHSYQNKKIKILKIRTTYTALKLICGTYLLSKPFLPVLFYNIYFDTCKEYSASVHLLLFFSSQKSVGNYINV